MSSMSVPPIWQIGVAQPPSFPAPKSNHVLKEIFFVSQGFGQNAWYICLKRVALSVLEVVHSPAQPSQPSHPSAWWARLSRNSISEAPIKIFLWKGHCFGRSNLSTCICRETISMWFQRRHPKEHSTPTHTGNFLRGLECVILMGRLWI